MNTRIKHFCSPEYMKIIAVILVVFLQFQFLVASENENTVSVTFYTIHDGLSGNGITSIYQDSKGFLWIGTQDGLNRYDGYNFEVYRYNIDDPNSISGNYIQCITEDAEGNLWIGTINNGLNKWSRSTGLFTRFNSDSKVSRLPEENIYGLQFDKDSTLWIKTDNYLLGFNIDSLELRTYGLYSNIFQSYDKVSSPILNISPSYLWVGTKEGVVQFNKENRLYERMPLTNNDFINLEIGQVSSFLPYGEENILVGSSDGVFQFKKNDKGFYGVNEIFLPSAKENFVKAMVEHSDGRIWLGTKSGLRVLSKKEGEKEFFYNDQYFFNKAENEITSSEITCLFEDKSGILWAGTLYDGIVKIDFKPKKFTSIKKGSKKYPNLNHYDIKSILTDNSGKIWLGTSDDGVKVLDPDKGSITSYVVNKTLNIKSEDAVLTICEDSKDRIWLGTSTGIYIYYIKNGLVVEYSYLNNEEYKALLGENRINAILEDSKGNMWFGTQFGLYKSNGSVIQKFFADKENPKSICSDEINALFEDSESILWIGTSDGVNFIEGKQSNFKGFGRLRNMGDSVSVLSNNFITSITEDSKRKIWFGTRSGLTYYNKIDNEFGFYSHENGLANDMVYGVECDNNNDVWISSNKGISKINNQGDIFNYDISDGLPGYVYNIGATTKSNDGTLYFAGVDGVAIIKPDSVSYNLHPPKVIITSVVLSYKGKNIKRFRGNEKSITLKYRSSSVITVSYAALEYSEPSKNKFQVYLKGFDDGYRQVTSSNKISLSNLPSGNYTLYVKGCNSDYIWNHTPAQISFKIVPPIWMSTYAYAFYLIAVVFLFQMIINYRIRYYKKAYRSLQEKAVDKKKIEAQKELLSRINQSLTDSIYYAKRIQESILPSDEEFRSIIPESFIYFRPKDLVSGDFYWMYESEKYIYVAAVDCTGHGVPGAFMSIIAYDMLKSIVTTSKEYCPAKILDALNREVISTFKKDQSNAHENKMKVDDGMDLALCVIHKESRVLSFAGAYNPLYLIRNNEIFAYKGDRFPIGYSIDKHFSKHEISLLDSDVIYIFSDGYTDQFGGPEGKKFKYRRFRHLLLNIHKLPFEDQQAILHQKIEEWMAGYDQVDDIIVLGMKPVGGLRS